MAFTFDLRKVIVVFIIAILTAVLAHAITVAIMPSPQYEDFCSQYYPKADPAAPYGYKEHQQNFTCPVFDDTQSAACTRERGMADYKYDQYGCPISMTCNYCNRDLQAAQKKFNFIMFITDSIVALIAIFIALSLPAKKDVSNWIGTGLMFGGLISLFAGTVVYYSDLDRFVRPIVIFAELVLVIYLAYKKLSKN